MIQIHNPTGLESPMKTVASLLPFFQPKSIAVVGASRDSSSIGYRLLDTIVQGGFTGQIFPINPKATEILGFRTYSTVTEIPGTVELAVIAVPRDAVLSVVDECAAKGIKAVLVISAGFAEVGEAGKTLQQQLTQTVRAEGIRLIGPNCLGLLTTQPDVKLNATFVPVSVPTGSVAMSSDSGALGLAILARAAQAGIGISSFVSVGNRGDVSSNDLLEYWEQDPQTEVILLYLESFGNPRRFAQIAQRVSRTKPIVVVKGGRTAAGQRAAGSHTAALAADNIAVDALFGQTGVIRTETLEDMFHLVTALGHQPLPQGHRVGIVTNAGGPAILCSDMCESQGLCVPELSEKTQSQLASYLPSAASLANPVDMIASAGPADFEETIQVLMKSGEVDSLIVIYVAAEQTVAEQIPPVISSAVANARVHGTTSVPVLACFMPELPRKPQVNNSEIIPYYQFPEQPARALGKMAAYSRWRNQSVGHYSDYTDVDLVAAKTICAKALDSRGPGWLTTQETRSLLRAFRLPVSAGGVARTATEATTFAKQLGFPVAVKLASRQILHKTEFGGVHLNLTNAQEVRAAFESIRDKLASEGQSGAMEGVLVQPMIEGGTEVMVGVTHDSLFGHLLAFGLGGIHVEILGDVVFRVAPISDQDARQMIQSIRGSRLLSGYRGHPPADVGALEDLILRISHLVTHIPEVAEMDLNPIFALAPGEGCRIVDARIKVQSIGRLEFQTGA
ncbi:MAG: acetate--CoA ligase family protein [Gemmataceae bacterium]